MAKHAFIECSRPGAMGSFVIRIMGNTVGALFRESRGPADPSYLQFIDWTMGTVNPVRCFRLLPMPCVIYPI